jgi:thiol-disulfide isomerase/thioredoxin
MNTTYLEIKKMKLLSVLLLLVFSNMSLAQKGYQIDVNIKSFKNQYIYLGYYFGKTLPIKDSVKLNDKGIGTFKGTEKLKSGVYLIGFPNKNGFFEILVGDAQFFSITTDTPNISKRLVIKNNPDGLQFQNYQNFMEQKGNEIKTLEKLPQTTEPQKKLLLNKRKVINDAVQLYRKGIMTKSPKGLLTAIFKTIEEPIVPEGNKHPGGKYDSTYAWYYYKSNYWNGVSFKDDRLLRTPVFEPKLEKYFKSIVYPSPDSIIKEVDKILVPASPNPEMFKYLASKFIEKYINPEYMGQDAVYVHIFEKYIASGMVDWYDEKQKKILNDRAYSLMANKLGDKSPPLDLVDTLNNPVSLYNIKSEYTVICFWDATCGHCKEVVPKLDSIYNAKWKKLGVTIFGVMTDGGVPAWKKYIVENKFTAWIHAYQTQEQKDADYAANRPNFRQLYDITTTPKLYLLDKEKRIIAKQLTYEQIDDLLTKKISTQ